MANLPNPKSYEQILGDMLASYMSRIGVNDLNTGSAVTSFFEAFAQAVYRSSGDTFSILREFSVDRAEGEALQKIAAEERLTPFPARQSTGKVVITDTSFQKISSKIYAGGTPVNIGSIKIAVSDASLFPSSGSLYIGRGTSNIEGPIAYTNPTMVGSYWEIDLSTPTSKYHNVSESVVLSQGGNRSIPTGTSVKTVSSGSFGELLFLTTSNSVILDGEVEITNIPVAAQNTGAEGNIPKNAIKEFVSVPFIGAVVTNLTPFTTGRDSETDSQLRLRIKKARISKGLGTAEAIKGATINAYAADENATITSNEIFSADKTVLYIDNGEGYEEKYKGVGLEYIVDSALGGENSFQLQMAGNQSSVVKAFLDSNESAPFNVNPTDRLAILVGGILSEHVFGSNDFRSNGAATAYEIVASINANSDIDFTARTIDNGNKVSIQAKEEINEFLQKTEPTSGTDVAIALGLSEVEVETVKIYKNKELLSRNGRVASLESENQNSWSNTITGGDTLILSVDGTSFITYSFNDSDFLAEGTYITVSKSNSLSSWVNVINNKIVGVTASINGSRLVLTSNIGTNSRAKLEVDPSSTLVVKGVFSASNLLVTGKTVDYTLSRNTAQFKLKNPLEKGDSLTAGTEFTRGEVTNTPVLGGVVSFSSEANIWLLLDTPLAEIINHGATSGSLVSISKQGANKIRFKSSNVNPFINVQSGDYFIIWSNELSSGNRLEGRVCAVGTDSNANDYFEFITTANQYAAAVNEAGLTFKEGLKFVRSDYAPQKIVIPAGSYNINVLADLMQDTMQGYTIYTENEEYLNIRSNTYETTGSVMVVAFNESGKNLNFTEGQSSISSFSHVAYQESENMSSQFPLFIHSSVSTDVSANSPTALLTNFDSAIDLTTLGVDQNSMICFLNPYLSNSTYGKDNQASKECVQINSILANDVEIDTNYIIKSLRVNDRFFVASPYDFGHSDSLTVILDGDATNKTFPMNLYRRAITNTTMPVNANEFRAYDVDSGASTEFSQFFGAGFDFKNYKAYMQAKNVIDPTTLIDKDAVLFRAAQWGLAGEKVNVGYIYPDSANLSIFHKININENVEIRIGLKSGPAVLNSIDGTTEWNVTVTPNTPTPGKDEVTFTWSNVGSDPQMTTLAAGHFVHVKTTGEFNVANTGVYKVSSATSTSFTVRMPTGQAVIENNRATLESATISLYQNDDTTALEIETYVNANLVDFLTAQIIDDNGATGDGIISLSTYEDNDFVLASSYVQLMDGLNYMELSELSNLAPFRQFRFKNTLLLPSFSTNTPDAYKFSDEEEVRFVPTTSSQITQFLSVLAVSGITTLGEVLDSSRNTKIQFNTQKFGNSGSVEVTGGTSNNPQALVTNVASIIPGEDLTKLTIAKSGSTGFHADQWIKLQATNVQKKVTGISFTTNVTITPNSPSPTTSIIELGNMETDDRYFGQPKTNVRTRGRYFHVEKHGSLVCISWDGVGSSPMLSKTVEINADGGNMSVVFNSSTLLTEYNVISGTRRFSEVNIGDSVVIQNFANPANNGTFVVKGVSTNGLTIAVDNSSGVSASSAPAASGDLVITTEVKEGDTVEIRAPFASLNQGKFKVIRRYQNSFYIENSTAIEERLFMSDNLRSLGFSATTEFNVTVSGDMVLTWNGTGTQPTLSNAKLGDTITIGTGFAVNNRGTFMVTDSGSNYLKCANAKAVAESNVNVTSLGGDVLECQSPAMVFYEYEAAVAGDRFIVSGNVLGSANKGTYSIVEVLSKKRIVVSSILTAISSVQLNNLSVQVYVEEELPYYGYKQIYNKTVDPANANSVILILENTNQFSKINKNSNMVVSTVSKLNFSEIIKKGIDAYKYHTGLIAEANKIVYGSSRDPISYPGVSAAGAEIFIEPPLVRRVEISINIRVRTGVPFIRITEQVRNNIAALINSSPIGRSIAISDIISVVNAIPGTTAISITSPSYSPSNDVIVINPSEKPLILDIVNDIIVSKVE